MHVFCVFCVIGELLCVWCARSISCIEIICVLGDWHMEVLENILSGTVYKTGIGNEEK